MAKRPRQKERGAIVGAFAWRLIEMLESPAYRALSLSAHRALSRLEIELYHHGGKPEENGKLPCTYEHFVEYGIERHAVAPAIRELVALGFIEITRQGCAGNAGFRVPTLYRLTYRHCGSHRETTDEWRRIKTEGEAMEIAKRARASVPNRRPKNRSPVRETPTGPSAGNPTNGEDSPVRETHTTVPVRETHTTSISRRVATTTEKGCDDGATPPDALRALVAKLPWSPPRWIEINPELDEALNCVIDGRARPGRTAPVDALTEIEGLILSNTLPDGSAVREAVH